MTQLKRFDRAILLRLQAVTTERLKQAAAGRELSVSDYVRQTLRAALDRDLGKRAGER